MWGCGWFQSKTRVTTDLGYQLLHLKTEWSRKLKEDRDKIKRRHKSIVNDFRMIHSPLNVTK